MRKISTIIMLVLIASTAVGQKGNTKFGFQLKPIVPNRLIGFYEQPFNKDQFESTVTQKFGFSGGMRLRVGLSDRLALESGINYNQRNYDLNFAVPDSGYSGLNDVGVVSYEIPLSFMVFIRLADDIYMNTSVGPALTFFPSDVRTYTPIGANERFQQEGAYRSKAQGAVNANIGFEWRNKDVGTFYLGSSYHLPFAPIMTFAMSYEYNASQNVVVRQNISGSYLTIDLRYYLPESKESKSNN